MTGLIFFCSEDFNLKAGNKGDLLCNNIPGISLCLYYSTQCSYCQELIPEYKTGIIHLTRKDYADFEIARGDTEGIVNHILMVQGIEVAAFITEQPTIVKLSLRSKGDISVQEIARDHFKGGGHKNASGGAAYAKLGDVIDKFKKVLPNYIKYQHNYRP